MSEKMIMIRNGMCHVLSANVVGTLPMTDFLESIKKRFSVAPIFVPYADESCACFCQNTNKKFFLMYLEPKKRIIHLNDLRHPGTEQLFHVITPHIYLGIFFRGGAVSQGFAAAAKTKIKSKSDELFQAPLPNLSPPYGKVCEGTKAMWPVDADPLETASSYVRYFLKSQFNQDIMPDVNNLPEEIRPILEEDLRGYDVLKLYFKRWEDYSKEHSVEEVCNLDWGRPEKFSVTTLLASMWGTEDDGQDEDEESIL